MPNAHRLLRKQLHCLIDQLPDADLDIVYQLLAALVTEETSRPPDQRIWEVLRHRLGPPAWVR